MPERPSTEPQPDTLERRVEALAAGSLLRDHLDVGRFWWGPLALPVVIAKGARPGPKLVVTAGQHGGEGYGVLGLLKAIEALQPETIAGEVWAIPCMNIFGYMHAQHGSPLDQQDMNRVYPGAAQGTMTQQIVDAVFRRIISGADLVLDLHGGTPDFGNHPLARWVDVEGKPSVSDLARSYGIEYVMPPGGRAIPGMISLAVQEIGVPMISIEHGNGVVYPGPTTDAIAGHVAVTMAWLGMTDAPRPDPGSVRVVTMTGVRSHTAGAFETFVRLGDNVEAGQLLGVVRDFHAQVVQEARLETSGVVGVLRTGVRVHAGESLVWLLVDA